MKDILSLVRSRFLETCWHLQSYRHSKACLEHVSYLRMAFAHLYTILISKQTYLRPFNTNKDRIKQYKKEIKIMGI